MEELFQSDKLLCIGKDPLGNLRSVYSPILREDLITPPLSQSRLRIFPLDELVRDRVRIQGVVVGVIRRY